MYIIFFINFKSNSPTTILITKTNSVVIIWAILKQEIDIKNLNVLVEARSWILLYYFKKAMKGSNIKVAKINYISISLGY